MELGQVVVRLSGPLTIQTAEAVHQRLCAALSEGGPVTVDCAAASEIDVTFIQLLLAARRGAAETGRDFALAGPAEGALLKTLRQAGLMTEDGGDCEDSQFWTKRRA